MARLTIEVPDDVAEDLVALLKKLDIPAEISASEIPILSPEDISARRDRRLRLLESSPAERLRLPSRVSNFLRRAARPVQRLGLPVISTTEDLCRLNEQVLPVYGSMGKGSLKSLKDALAAEGLRLGMTTLEFEAYIEGRNFSSAD